MVLIDLLAHVAEFAGIALGAAIVGIPPAVAIVATLAVHSLVVFTRGYRGFERLAVALSLSLFAFVVLAITRGPDPRELVSGL
jgi:Mn2+/Fe2+ NRAMP family transporter